MSRKIISNSIAGILMLSVCLYSAAQDIRLMASNRLEIAVRGAQEAAGSEGPFESSKTAGDLLEDFFANTGCLHPEQQEELEEKMEDDGISPIPEALQRRIESIKDAEVSALNEQSLRALVHLYRLPDSEDPSYLDNSSTYGQLNTQSLMNTEMAYFSFVYDCSGFVTSVAHLDFDFTFAELGTSTQFAANQQYVYSASRGQIYPAIAKAIDPENTGNLPLSAESSSSILFALLNRMGDADRVFVPRMIDALSWDTHLSSTLQGDVSAEASTNANFILGNVDAELEASNTITRKLVVSEPRSATLNLGEDEEYPIDQVLSRLKRTISETSASAENKGREIVVNSKLLSNVCLVAEWQADVYELGESTPTVESALVHAQTGNGCAFTISIANNAGDFLDTDAFVVVKMVGLESYYAADPPQMKMVAN